MNQRLLNFHYVDKNKTGVMGYSMGGVSTILAAYEEIAKNVTKKDIRFALHVPFYAPCIVLPENGTGTGAPIKETSMQCNFCHKEITEDGHVWLNKQWCVISHVRATHLMQ